MAAHSVADIGHSGKRFRLCAQGRRERREEAMREKWRKDLVKEFGGRVNPVTGSGLGWGYSWSPLVAGNRIK